MTTLLLLISFILISVSSFAQTDGTTIWNGEKNFPRSSWASLDIPKGNLGDLSKVKSLHLSYQERGKTFYETPDQSTGFPIYYKPEGTNRCGDPMPFYDTKTNKYKVLYLYETTNNGTFFHPLHGVETSDAFSYTNLGEVRPVGDGTAGKDASIGTGSCVIGSDGNYHLFYTRHDNQRGTYDAENPKECIMHVSSATFEGLKTETPSIIIKPDANNYSRYDFRDPEVFKDDNGTWHMLVSTKINQGQGDERSVIAEYTSSNLITWTHKGIFIYCMWGDGENPRFYECPNVFKMGNYWYLVYSELNKGMRRVQYFKATASGADGLEGLRSVVTFSSGYSAVWPDNKEGILTSRGYYAGKTASNGTERIMWGWSSYPNDGDDKHEWAGALVAHKLQQDANGCLTLVEPTSFATNFNETKTIEAKERDRHHILYGRLGYHTRTTFTVTVPDKRNWNGEGSDSKRDWARNFSLCFARGDRDNSSWYELMFECNGDGTKRSIKMYKKGSVDQYIDGQDSYEFVQPASVAAPSNYEKNYKLINYHITMITDNSVLTLYVKDDAGNTLCTYTCRIPNLARNCWGLGLYGTNPEDEGDYNDTRITNITYKEYKSADNASDCILNVLTAWDREDKVLARQNTANTKMYGSYAIIDLSGINLEEKFAECENLIIQIHPELGGDLVLTSVSINDNTPLWEGRSYIDWLPEEGNITVKIPASEFLKRDLRIGQRITVEVEKGSFMPADYIELHDGTQILPGSRYKHWITENQTITIYVTHGMFAHLLNNGLEVCGRDFYLKKVCLLDRQEADNIKASSIWSNYFWSYNKQDFDHASGTWTGDNSGFATMDVPCEAFETIVGTKEQLNTARLADYKAMRFYYEHGDDNAFEVLTGFGSGESLGSTDTYGTYTKGSSTFKYAELPLTEERIALLQQACAKPNPNNRFYVRFNNGDTHKEYNFTDITLVPGAMTLAADAVATFSSMESVKVEGLQAYTVKKGNSENEVECVLIEDGIVPAGTGVLLHNNTKSAARGTFITTDGNNATHDFSNNLLHATSRADHNLEPVPSTKVYCLYGGTKIFGPYGSTSFQSNKCFLQLPAQVNPAKQITMKIPSRIVTGIADRPKASRSTNAAIYNMAGQKVSSSYKGVIIKNNKKYILK